MSDPYFAFHFADFQGDMDVLRMTPAEGGAFILLMCRAWLDSPPMSVPDDDKALAAYTRCTPAQWARMREGVLRAFIMGADGRWYCKLLLKWFEYPHRLPSECSTGEAYVRRLARMQAAKALGTHDPAEWHALVIVCNGVCPRCQKPAKLTQDHITPVSDGGSDAIDNLQPLCKPCNTAKRKETTDWFSIRHCGGQPR